MSAWAALEAELAAWRAADRVAPLWWRDDDAARDCAALERLFRLASDLNMPLALAAVPESLDPRLSASMAGAPEGSAALQHGYSHFNHAPPGLGKKWELGNHRPLALIGEELRRGQGEMAAVFGDRNLPVMVPPWNRIASEVTALLPSLGFTGLSTFGPRAPQEPGAGLTQVNCHIDIFQWKPRHAFLGAATVLRRVSEVLREMRLREPAALEPIGLMTHHLVHDAETWAFLTDLLQLLCGGSGACILSPRRLWEHSRGATGARSGPTGG